MQGFRTHMEDAMSVRMGLSANLPRHCFAGVFDGHAGQKASQYLSETLVNRVAELKDPTNHQALVDCVLGVDASFLSSHSPDEKDHGSTCIFTVFHPIHAESETDESKKSWKLVVCNVGDSRAMILRKNGQCVTLSRDHKPEDPEEEARINRAGGFVRENRVDGQLAMSRAIGDYQYKNNPQLSVTDQKVIPVCEIQEDTIYAGDQLFICCDGIVEHMENDDACAVITEELQKLPTDAKAPDCADIIPAVFERALATGSKDNMSGILVHFGEHNYPADAKASQYIPGPFSAYANDEMFYKAYQDDALKHGQDPEGWLDLAREVPCETVVSSPYASIPGLGNVSPQRLQQLLPFLQAQMRAGDDDDMM
jgi:protein phosphatase